MIQLNRPSTLLNLTGWRLKVECVRRNRTIYIHTSSVHSAQGLAESAARHQRPNETKMFDKDKEGRNVIII